MSHVLRLPHLQLALTAVLALSAACVEEVDTFDDELADSLAEKPCSSYPKESMDVDLVAKYELDTPAQQQQRLLCQSTGYRTLPLEFPLPERAFDMCFTAPQPSVLDDGHGVDLTQAKWLSFLAGNQYAHYAHLAPALEQMGFGDVGDGERWVQNAANTRKLKIRDYVNEAKFDNQLGPEDFDQDGKRIRFEPLWSRELVQQVVPGQKIQFFSAGNIEDVKSEVDNVTRETFVDQSTQFFWAEHRNENAVIVSFRGTEDKGEDLATDLSFGWERHWLRDTIYGNVHGGFLEAFNRIQVMLGEKLKAESGRGLTIYITGHSLGAALATFASIYIMDRIERQRESGMSEDEVYKLGGLYTFGSPRVGTSQFAEQAEAKYNEHGVSAMRFRNANDTVTRYPSLLTHVGHLMHFLKDSEELSYNAEDQDPTVSDLYFWEHFGDHPVGKYYKRTSEALTLYPELGFSCQHSVD